MIEVAILKIPNVSRGSVLAKIILMVIKPIILRKIRRPIKLKKDFLTLVLISSKLSGLSIRELSFKQN